MATELNHLTHAVLTLLVQQWNREEWYKSNPHMGQGEMGDGGWEWGGTHVVHAWHIFSLYNQSSSTRHRVAFQWPSKKRGPLTCSISSCASFTRSTLFVSTERAAALLSMSEEWEALQLVENPNNSRGCKKQQCSHLKGVPRTRAAGECKILLIYILWVPRQGG